MTVQKKDYYEVLGVAKEASFEDIRKAYHKIALKNHPDRNPGNAAAERAFKEAAEAYDVLRDPEKRKKYDQLGHEGLQGFAGREFHSFEDIFDAFGDVFAGDALFEGLFGRGRSGARRRRGAHLETEVEVDFREVMKGAVRTIHLDRAAPCPDCRGSGAKPGTRPADCKACEGRGEVLQTRGFLHIRMPCAKCRGAGTVIASPCPKCRGGGHVRREEHLEVQIPPGVEDGTQLRLSGQGEAGENGSPPGDLFVVIRVKEDRMFERREDDVICRVPIHYAQAALGAEIEVPTLTGKATMMKIPPGTQSNQVFRLRSQGFPSIHGYGRGDQLVEVMIEVPKSLTTEQEQLMKQLARIEEKNLGPMRKGFLDRLKEYFSE